MERTFKKKKKRKEKVKYIIRANQIPAFLSCRNDPAAAGPHQKRNVGQSCDKSVDNCKSMWQKMKVTKIYAPKAQDSYEQKRFMRQNKPFPKKLHQTIEDKVAMYACMETIYQSAHRLLNKLIR